MDVLYPVRCRVWTIWSLHGVRDVSSVKSVHNDANCSNSWAHEICADDNEERAIVVASMNDIAYVLQAWLPLLVWQQIDAPQYQKGFITITFLSAAMIGTGFVTKALHRAQIQRFVQVPGGRL